MIVTSSKVLGTTTRFLVLINKLKMSKFAAEKEKYLNMPKEMKRKEYVNRSFVELKDVPTWAEYYEANIAKVTVKLEKTVVEYEKGMTTHPKVNKEFNKLVSMWQGDITSLEIDAVVNAANNSLMGGGGVDGAIHRAAGPMLKEETKTLGGCETGQAKITGGYKLPAKYIIHTVGPRGETTELLQSCYNNSLKLLVENNLRTVAFPCISTGIYGYPQIAAAHVALGCVRGFLEKHSAKVDRIIFALFLDEDVNIYEYLMRLYFPVS